MTDSRDPPPRPRAGSDHEDPDENAEAAWLAAGKREDVERMRALRLRHPRALALDRVLRVNVCQLHPIPFQSGLTPTLW